MPVNSVSVPEDHHGPIIGLPSGVDYECVKRFFLMLPPWMTTLTWMTTPPAEEATWHSFAGKTFRTVDRLLCQRQAALAQQPNDETEAERRTVAALRGLWIQQLLDELRRPLARSLWIVTRMISVPGPASTTHSVTSVDAWTIEGRRLRLLEHHTIAPTVKHWGGDRVNDFDLDAVNTALAEVLRRHARDLLSRRCGARWRSRRRPAGWPIITRYVIPWLYDYLRPFYAARGYRHRFKHPSAGRYPVKVRQDILGILRFERPDLAGDLALAHVTAAIQYHLRTAASNRPMGEKLCAELRRVRRRKPV